MYDKDTFWAYVNSFFSFFLHCFTPSVYYFSQCREYTIPPTQTSNPCASYISAKCHKFIITQISTGTGRTQNLSEASKSVGPAASESAKAVAKGILPITTSMGSSCVCVCVHSFVYGGKYVFYDFMLSTFYA